MSSGAVCLYHRDVCVHLPSHTVGSDSLASHSLPLLSSLCGVWRLTQGSSGCWSPPFHLLFSTPSFPFSPFPAPLLVEIREAEKPNPYIKRELEKYLEQNLLTVHPRSVLGPILNQEMALNSRSKHRNKGCQHRNQKQSLTGRGERTWHKAWMGDETQEGGFLDWL